MRKMRTKILAAVSTRLIPDGITSARLVILGKRGFGFLGYSGDQRQSWKNKRKELTVLTKSVAPIRT